jgi:type VI secretion system protein ImpH
MTAETVSLDEVPARRATGRAQKDLLERLLSQSHEFGFFQAIRILKQSIRNDHSGGDGAGAPQDIRFRAQVSLSFPPSELAEISVVQGASRPAYAVVVNFMGLTGPQGVLPVSYSVALASAEPEVQEGTREFLDLFNDRAVALFWEAWRKSHLCLGPEQGCDDELAFYLLALAGIDRQVLADTDFAATTLAHFAGLLSRQPVSCQAAEQVLGQWLDASVVVEPCLASWEPIDARHQTRLGADNHGLCGEFVLGDTAHSRSARVGIRVGPLVQEAFESLLPGQTAHRQLKTLSRVLFGGNLDIECRLVRDRLGLHDATDPGAFVLGPRGRQLGLSSWLAVKPLDEDPDNVHFLWQTKRSGSSDGIQP